MESIQEIAESSLMLKISKKNLFVQTSLNSFMLEKDSPMHLLFKNMYSNYWYVDLSLHVTLEEHKFTSERVHPDRYGNETGVVH